MANYFREFYLPLMFIAIVIGYQISGYFLYLHAKYKNEKIKFNNLLLGYGLIFGITLTGFTIRILNLYFLRIYYPKIFSPLVRTTYLLLYTGIMVFYLIISSKVFNAIIRTNFIRALSFLLLIPIFCSLIMTIETLLYSTIAGITLVLYYSIILKFQNKLAQLTTGDIRKRLNLIFWAIMLIFVSHFLGGYTPSNVLLSAYTDLLQIISVPLFIIGLLIFFLGAYKFPMFLEFDWKENIISLYVVNRVNFEILYQYHFNLVPISNHEQWEEQEKGSNILFSRGLIGMESIISFISESTNDNVDKISHQKYLILIQHAEKPFDFLIFYLFVKKELNSLRYIIKQVKEEFIKLYSPILMKIAQSKEFEQKLFSSFDNVIKQKILTND
ncbi:MAG: hypothetical protein ACTSYC_07070 [Promethearchaeota archaeon]